MLDSDPAHSRRRRRDAVRLRVRHAHLARSRRSCRAMAFRPPKCWMRCAARTCSSRRVRSAVRPRVAGAGAHRVGLRGEPLQRPEQFRQIILRSSPDGATVRLGDVARVEIGAQTYARARDSTASRSPLSRCSCCPAPMRCRSPKPCKARMEELASQLSARRAAGWCRSTARPSCASRSRKWC